MVLVDTSVVLDVLQDDPVWATWSIAQMRAHAQLHELVINPVIYAELSAAFSRMEALDEVLAQLQFTVQPIPKPALFLAGKAFVAYRRRGGTRTQVMPDFFICAHAAVQRWPLLTRDPRRFRSAFVGLAVIAPQVG